MSGTALRSSVPITDRVPAVGFGGSEPSVGAATGVVVTEPGSNGCPATGADRPASVPGDAVDRPTRRAVATTATTTTTSAPARRIEVMDREAPRAALGQPEGGTAVGPRSPSLVVVQLLGPHDLLVLAGSSRRAGATDRLPGLLGELEATVEPVARVVGPVAARLALRQPVPRGDPLCGSAATKASASALLSAASAVPSAPPPASIQAAATRTRARPPRRRRRSGGAGARAGPTTDQAGTAPCRSGGPDSDRSRHRLRSTSPSSWR